MQRATRTRATLARAPGNHTLTWNEYLGNSALLPQPWVTTRHPQQSGAGIRGGGGAMTGNAIRTSLAGRRVGAAFVAGPRQQAACRAPIQASRHGSEGGNFENELHGLCD
jgi:hypothetical protein